MASLVGLGTKEGEEYAADLDPVATPLPKDAEQKMAALEELSTKQMTVQLHVRYRENIRSPIRNLEEGKDYELLDGQVRLSFTPPKGSYIGLRRTGENELGTFDHTTWIPGAGAKK